MIDYGAHMDGQVLEERDRAAEARHGGRYITGALAHAIDNDTIRRRFAGEEGAEALAEIWRYTASPSGSNWPASGRDTTQRYARHAARIGGVDWGALRLLARPGAAPSSAFDWPIYMIAVGQWEWLPPVGSEADVQDGTPIG